MSPRTTTDVLQALTDSGAEFRAAASIPDAQANVKPAPGRWSVLDCIEHIVSVEDRFVGWLRNPETQSTVLPSAPPMNKEREAQIVTRVASRANRVQAPETAHPKGRFSSLAEALEQFDAVRARSIAFAESQGDGLYSLVVTHPFFGPLNGVEAMLLMAAHSRRHAAQILEVRVAL